MIDEKESGCCPIRIFISFVWNLTLSWAMQNKICFLTRIFSLEYYYLPNHETSINIFNLPFFTPFYKLVWQLVFTKDYPKKQYIFSSIFAFLISILNLFSVFGIYVDPLKLFWDNIKSSPFTFCIISLLPVIPSLAINIESP